MKYMGSKNKIANEILPIILKDRIENQYYIEPFVGGCNMIDKVDGKRIALDANPFLIAMWRGLQNKPSDLIMEIPKSLYDYYRDKFKRFNKKEFQNLKFYEDNENELFMIGWIGFMASFNGRFYDGGYSGKTDKRDYVDEQIRNTLLQIDYIKDVDFRFITSYENFEYPDNSLIYCDIPYKDTKQYIYSKNFDYEKFWSWCRKMNDKGHKIYISEYQAPDDFVCVFEKQITNSMNTTKTYKPIEKLFTLNK